MTLSSPGQKNLLSQLDTASLLNATELRSVRARVDELPEVTPKQTVAHTSDEIEKGQNMFCKNCAGKMVIANIGHCSACGGMTSSGMYKLCASCSQQKQECQSCRVSLAKPSNPGNSPGNGGNAQKLSFIVAIDTDHYLPGGAPTGSDAIAIHLQSAFESFKRDLSAWVQSRSALPDGEVTVRTELPRLSTVVVECSEETAESLKYMPGVALVAPNGTVKAS